MIALIDEPPIVPPTLHVGVPTELAGFSVFPVWTDRAPAKRALSTLIPGPVSFAELEAGPSVSALMVNNTASEPFLLLEGVVVAGGWQDRVVTVDRIVAPGGTWTIEVRCVEQARWGRGDRQLRDARRAPVGVLGALRDIGAGPVDRRWHDAGVRAGAPGYAADQGEVWNRVASYQAAYGPSPTGSLNHALDRADELFDDAPELPVLPGQQGVVVAANGHPVLAEVFNHPRQLREQLPRITAALLADRHRLRPGPVPGHRVRTFATAASALLLDRDDTGPGDALADVGIRGRGGNDLVDVRAIGDHRGRLQHLSVLNRRHELLRT